ncbi:MAG: hypothetical protein ABR616_11710 [Dermatophilaceae bacterium]
MSAIRVRLSGKRARHCECAVARDGYLSCIMMDGWKVELLVIPGVPWRAEEASTFLRTALNDIGLTDATFVRIIDPDDAACARGFARSSAFVVGGGDLFDSGDSQGSMACRMYLTPDGPSSLPALQGRRAALKRRTATA